MTMQKKTALFSSRVLLVEDNAKPLTPDDLRELFGKGLSAGRGGSTDEPVGSKLTAGGNQLARSNKSR
jgi:hypothetical protein